MLATIKVINLAIRFLLELCMLAVFGYWGFHTAGGSYMHLLLGIGLPLVVAFIWGIFLSPKAKVKPHIAIRVCMELVLFCVAAWLLYTLGFSVLGAALIITFIVNRAILLLLRHKLQIA